MLKKFFLLTLTLAMAFSATGLMAQTKIVNGYDDLSPPFSFRGDNGQAQGFDIDCVNWIAE
ncbi:MAG: transporter substrate-binding domain-containing protein, partial [Deltaproteobacteria bacterium]|nr:transporter substrate-binding domain-containing protein [Deltaproteobacteria bacterium]